MSRVVIDPGHGGMQDVGGSSANNATGPAGTFEKDLTLDIAKLVQDHLIDHQVILTRTTDTNLSLADRAKVAFDASADVFISIHFNGFHDATVQGTETWIHSNGDDEDRLLAESVQNRLVATTGYHDRGVRDMELGVLRPNRHRPTTASCLAEVSFLTDSNEENRLSDANYRDQIAQAIARAARNYIERQSTG